MDSEYWQSQEEPIPASKKNMYKAAAHKSLDTSNILEAFRKATLDNNLQPLNQSLIEEIMQPKALDSFKGGMIHIRKHAQEEKASWNLSLMRERFDIAGDASQLKRRGRPKKAEGIISTGSKKNKVGEKF